MARDPDRLSRFEGDARAVAALNHPNILTVFDVGTHEGTPYVVTELLEGETLRELVSRRAPTQRQVLFFLSQAAHGLEAAHAKGIVHRDVKLETPGRYAWFEKPTPDGRRLAAAIGRPTQAGLVDAEVVIIDLTRGTHRTVISHGPDVWATTLDKLEVGPFPGWKEVLTW